MAKNTGNRRAGTGPRPHVWIVGPDNNKHQMYIPWLKAKAQANFRNDEWNLEFEDYFAMWNGNWHLRGRQSDDLCMTRINWSGAWEKDNIQLVTRKQHCQAQAANTREKWDAKGLQRRYKPRGTGYVDK
jgi:hypothetical protein